MCHLFVFHFEFIRRSEEENLGAIKNDNNIKENYQRQSCNSIQTSLWERHICCRDKILLVSSKGNFRLQQELNVRPSDLLFSAFHLENPS